MKGGGVRGEGGTVLCVQGNVSVGSCLEPGDISRVWSAWKVFRRRPLLKLGPHSGRRVT